MTMGAIRIGVGPLALTRQAPAWMHPFQLALDFRAGRYQLNRQAVSLARIDSLYHSRASARRAQDTDGRSLEFPTGAMAITRFGYDSREGWSVLNANPLNPRAWVNSGSTSTNEPGDFLGFASASRAASGGATWHRPESAILGGLVAGGVYTVRVRYAAGSSARCRVAVRNSTTNQESLITGPAGALSIFSQTAGTLSNLVNTALGGGIFEMSATFTAGATGASASIGVGPDTSVVGDSVIVIAAQITQTTYPMPFGVGTIAPDSLVIPAADAGLSGNPWAGGRTLVTVWRGRAFNSFTGTPRVLDLRSDSDNRFALFFDKATSGLRGAAQSGAVSGLLVAGGAIPEGSEGTVVVVWRPDGQVTARWGGASSAAVARPIFTGDLGAVGLGNAGLVGSEWANCITRVFAAGYLGAISDAEILALWQQVSAS